MSESNTDSTSAEAEKDKNAKLNNSYVIGAGLLVLGIIVGVFFYEIMRMWGVKEVSVVDVKTSACRANKAAMKAPPPKTVKEHAKAPSLPVAAKEKTKEVKSISPQMKPPQEPARQKPVDVVSSQNQSKVGKGAVPEQLAQGKQSLQTSAPGEGLKYTVIGVGANVRSGPV